MRLSWLSNAPWSFTGYSNQTALFTPRLQRAGHDMAIIAFWGHDGTPINWNGVQVFGKSFHLYAQDVMHSHSVTWKADAMISLMDAWVVEPDGLQGTRWLPWFPIDHEPLPQRIHDVVKKAYARLVFSKFGCKQMNAAGLDYYYIPHGVDANVFKPLDMQASREKMKLPADKFIVGMVAANKGNPPRKAFQQNIAAFAALQAKHGDCVLYLHTIDGERGGYASVQLLPYIKALGLKVGYAFQPSAEGADVIFADQYGLTLGYPDDQMAALYSSMDVHMLVSMGEGFGIPILEAQACGAPVVVGDWTAMSELCFSGWKVDKKEAMPIFTDISAWQYLPHPAAIAERLEAAYRMRGNQDYRKRARAGAMKYDADKIVKEYWLPVLKKIEDRIAEENETVAKAKALVSADDHEWGGIGQYGTDGALYVPCLKCNDALRRDKDNSLSVVKDFYSLLEGLDFLPDTDGITKIVSHEIKRDYKLDDLNVKAGDYLIDVGAHKGVVSSYLAKKYPQATVLAFEPVKENYAALLENLKRNNITNVIAENMAVTKDGRPVQISIAESDNSGSGNIFSNGGVMVQSITLEDVFKLYNIERLPLLKIDCEGSEFEILGSANGLLKRVDVLRGEFHRGFGDADALLEKVRADIPDAIVTMQG